MEDPGDGERGENGSYLAHGVDGVVAQLLAENLAFLQADPMLAGDGALHLDGAAHHPIHHVFGRFLFRVVVEQDGVEIPVAHMATNPAEEAVLRDIVPGFLNDIGQPADRNGLESVSLGVGQVWGRGRSQAELTTSVVHT